MTRQIGVGDKIPDFVLKDHNNNDVRISDLKGRKVLLSFHPLAWTKICAQQMMSLEKNKQRFDELNTVALGLSVDTVPSKHAWAKDLGIKNTKLLSDFWPHGGVAKNLGIFREKEGFSERANILIDEEQKVILTKVYDISQLPDIEEIMNLIKKLKGGIRMNNMNELLSEAMNAEIKAKEFYESASAKAQSQAGKTFFKELAEFEQNHYEKVKKIIESRNKGIKLEFYKPMQIPKSVKPEVEGEFEPNKSEIADVLTLGIKAEKAAQDRYNKIADQLDSPEDKDIFKNLAEDERRHHDLLEAQFYQISNKGTIIWE
jgi:peroxiredoxin/rubrerythrin